MFELPRRLFVAIVTPEFYANGVRDSERRRRRGCHKEYFISTIVVPFLFWGCEAIVSFLRASDQFNAAPTFAIRRLRDRLLGDVFHPAVLSGAQSFPLFQNSNFLPDRIRTYRNYTLKLRIIVSFMRDKHNDIHREILKKVQRSWCISWIYFFAEWVLENEEKNRRTLFFLR